MVLVSLAPCGPNPPKSPENFRLKICLKILDRKFGRNLDGKFDQKFCRKFCKYSVENIAWKNWIKKLSEKLVEQNQMSEGKPLKRGFKRYVICKSIKLMCVQVVHIVATNTYRAKFFLLRFWLLVFWTGIRPHRSKLVTVSCEVTWFALFLPGTDTALMPIE